jgi:hypothetical protein
MAEASSTMSQNLPMNLAFAARCPYQAVEKLPALPSLR